MIFVIILLFLFIEGITPACEPRDNGFICICNSNDCDTVPEINIHDNHVQMMYTNADGGGFSLYETTTTNILDDNSVLIKVTDDQYQTIIGFGGAFTDAAGINIKKLTVDLQEKLLEGYFGPTGIEYNVARVPIGACDFSPRPYTLDDYHDGDVNLEYFSLQEEDLNYKIPIIQKAQELRGGKQLHLFGSAWTAPEWMKNESLPMLKREYFQTWADYHVKFFEEYLKHGIKFWGMTIGNEPRVSWRITEVPHMGWTTSDTAVYIKQYLGPTVRNSTNFSDLKIMTHDDNLDMVPFIAQPLFADDDVLKYIDGVALHWYSDRSLPPELRELTLTDKKNTFALKTESCHFVTEPILGNWDRAAVYIDDIFADLQYGYAGWVEWNLALNNTGGWSFINIPADAPIIISEDSSEFYKQPMFYAIGHFSKHIQPGSVRVGVDFTDGTLKALAFLRTDNIKVIIVYNPGTDNKIVQVQDGDVYTKPLTLAPRSINSILYLNP